MGGGGGGLFQAVGDFIGNVFSGLWTGLVQLGDWAFNNILTPVMNALGLEDEVILTVSCSSIRVYKDSKIYEKTKTEQLLRYIRQDDYTGRNYVEGWFNRGTSQLRRYYKVGKHKFIDFLPETVLHATSTSSDGVYSQISQHESATPNVSSTKLDIPTDEEWAKFKLQETQHYDVGNDLIIQGKTFYRFDSCYYDEGSKGLKAKLRAINPLKCTIIHYTVTEIYTEEDDGFYNAWKKVKPIPDGYDVKKTTVFDLKQYSEQNTSDVLYEEKDVVEEKYEGIPHNSEKSKEEESGREITTVSASNSDKEIDVGYHSGKIQVIATYSVEDTVKLFIHDTSDNTSSDIPSPYEVEYNIDCLPVATLRAAYRDLKDYETANVSSLTKERYDSTNKLLKTIGLSVDKACDMYQDTGNLNKVQNVFILFGVSPADDHPIVARVLWEILNYFYVSAPPAFDGIHSYAVSFKEYPFNFAMSWTPIESRIENKVIGTINTCKHSIISDNTKVVIKTFVTQIAYDWQGNPVPEGDLAGGSSAERTTTQVTYIYDKDDNLISEMKADLGKKTVGIAYANNETGDLSWDYSNCYGTAQPDAHPITCTNVQISTEESSKNGKTLIIEKQITPSTVEIQSCIDFSAFTIVRNEDDGGVVFDLDDVNLVIPLPADIIYNLPLGSNVQLYEHSLYLQFYAAHKEELAWYETEGFAATVQIVVGIVSLVITVIVIASTLGSATPLMMGGMTLATTALGKALVLGTIALVTALTLTAINQYVENPTLKAALSFGVMIGGIALGGGFSANANTAFTAIAVTSAAMQAVDIYVEADVQRRLKLLNEEYEDFVNKYNERQKEFNEIQEEFNSHLQAEDVANVVIDDVAQPITPNRFYYLAINSITDYDSMLSGIYDLLISKWHENQLQLMLGE